MNRIRSAAKDDLCRISEIEIFNYRLYFYPLFKSDEFYFRQLQVTALMKEYEKELSDLYVYDDGVIKGFIKIKDDEIVKLFVEPVLHDLKIGSALLEYAINEHDVKRLWALEKNKKVIAFYERHGFKVSEEKKPEEGTDEYLVLLTR